MRRENQLLTSIIESVLIAGLVPLCENMPSGKATKPGDVFTSMSGKTVQVGPAIAYIT